MAELTVHLTSNITAEVFPYRLMVPVIDQGLACEHLHIRGGRWFYCIRPLGHSNEHVSTIVPEKLGERPGILEWR